MNREDAFEGQLVRIKPDAKEHYAGWEGVITQIWPSPAYQWYDWALVDVSYEDCEHILFEDLEPVEIKESRLMYIIRLLNSHGKMEGLAMAADEKIIEDLQVYLQGLQQKPKGAKIEIVHEEEGADTSDPLKQIKTDALALIAALDEQAESYGEYRMVQFFEKDVALLRAAITGNPL